MDSWFYDGAKGIHVINNMKYQTFIIKIGFVLDDFAQL